MKSTSLSHTKILNGCLLFVFSALTLLTIACRKGKEDPLFSIRSRRERFVGTWHIEEANLRKDGQTITLYPEEGTLDFENLYVRTWGLNIFTDGKFTEIKTLVTDSGVQTHTYSGKWSFLGRSDGMENKEQVQLKYSEINELGYDGDSVFVKGRRIVSLKQTLTLVGLRHRTLHLQMGAGDLYDSGDLRFFEIFEQKKSLIPRLF